MDYSALNAAVSSASASSGRPAFDPAKAAAQGAQRFMKTYDANEDGSVSKDEFVTGLTAKGIPEADATKTYAALDKAGSGSITKADVESALKSGEVKAKDLGLPRPLPPNGRGPDGPPPAASGSSSGQIKQYDAADTNEDGAVSVQESANYAATQKSAVAATDIARLGTQVDQMV